MSMTPILDRGLGTVWLAAIASGLLMAFSNAPFDQWYLSYVAYVPLFLATRRLSPGMQGLAYALACTVIAVNWWHSTIIYSFWFFALIVGLLCVAFFIWGMLSALVREKYPHPAVELIVPCVIWVGIEGILSSEIVGIPCNIGISQSGQPVLIQSADLFGIYTTSFLIVLSNTTVALLLRALRQAESRSAAGWAAALAGLLVFGGNIVYGLHEQSASGALKNPLRVAVIQPVIDSDMYLNGWRSPDTRKFVKDTLDQLTDLAIETKPDILVWPEGGNGYLNMRIGELRDALYERAVRHKTDLLISSNDLDEGGRKYNTIFSISKHGKLLGRYNKVNLIPGAEDSYTPGEGFHAIPSSYGPVGPSICYESNFPSPLRKVTAKGAQLLVVSTSDAAFKKTSLTINHTRTAVFRAIENNRWVVHASNTGPSVIVSPAGKIVAESRFYERGYIGGDVEFIEEMTVYTRYGYILPLVFSGLVLALLAVALVSGLKALADLRSRRATPGNVPYFDAHSAAYMLKAQLQRTAFVRLPLVLVYVAFLAGIMTTSIVVVYRQVASDVAINVALREFFTPLDTLAIDKVTDKFLQAKNNSCGPAVMAYVFSYFGHEKTESDLIRQVAMTEKGTSMLEMKNVAIRNGFQASGVKENYTALLQEPLPVIAYINDSHYVVVNKLDERHVYLFDPAIGHVQVPRSYFEKVWNGYLLLVRVSPIVDQYLQAGSGNAKVSSAAEMADLRGAETDTAGGQ